MPKSYTPWKIFKMLVHLKVSPGSAIVTVILNAILLIDLKHE